MYLEGRSPFDNLPFRAHRPLNTSASPRPKTNPKFFLTRQFSPRMWNSLGIFQASFQQADPPAQTLQRRRHGVRIACCSLPNRIIPERRGMTSNCSEAMPYFSAIVVSMFLLGPEPLLPVDGREAGLDWVGRRKHFLAINQRNNFKFTAVGGRIQYHP